MAFQYLHIKGHQDKDLQRPLLVQEQHNVDCDQLAKQHVLATKTPSTTYGNLEFDAATPHLQINGKIICRKFIPALCEAAAKPPYWNYLQKKFQWTHSDTQNIHWSALNLALRSLPREDQRRIILFNHNKLPLRTSKFHPHMGSQLCPSCRRNPKDSQHFLGCNHSERRHLFEQLKQQLHTIVVKYSLHPSIFTTYWLGLLAIQNAIPFNDELPPILHPVIQHQSRLG